MKKLRNAISRLFRRSRPLTVDRQARRRTILSFTGLLVSGAAAWRGFSWLKNQPRDQGLLGGVQIPLRKVLDANGKVFRHTLSAGHLVKTYPPSAAVRNFRVNGDLGLKDPAFHTDDWRLQVTRQTEPGRPESTFTVTLEELRRLPKTSFAFDFKCIEGWSVITHWGGVRFSEFIRHYQLEKEAAMAYVALSTPDEKYYVGIDMASALHPQTLLCYEMNGQPLTLRHGYPLRLIIPVKYGIKNLKRIGNLSFSNERPPDYWYQRGYDYYSGL